MGQNEFHSDLTSYIKPVYLQAAREFATMPLISPDKYSAFIRNYVALYCKSTL